jgi:PAS domain S-box-containing protein
MSARAGVRLLSLRNKLLAALLGVGLLTLVATGVQAYRRAEAALHEASTSQLTSVREERRRQIEVYFAERRRDALSLAESRDITTAMGAFAIAFQDLQAAMARRPEAERARSRGLLERYYRFDFLRRLDAVDPPAAPSELARFLPEDEAAMLLQRVFIAENPNPEGARDRLDRPAGGGRYADVHAQINPFVRSIARQFGYSDLFLIDHETGRVVYTVAKRVEFARSLESTLYRNTRLGRGFRLSARAIDADFVQLVDFESYTPLLGAPAAFVLAPIFQEGRRLGVLALQIPLDHIDTIMTGNRRWVEHGLGRTGETYLVASDGRMRSDSRFFLEAPARYVEAQAKAGTATDLLQRMQAHGSTVLFQPIATAAARAALRGMTGTFTGPDYRDEPALIAYAPLAIPDLDWAIVAKLDVVEAFAPVTALRRALAWTGFVIAGLVVVIGAVLARSLTAPIHRLIGGMNVLGHGNLAHRLEERGHDEIAQIATAFNRMAGDLQTTTVSRDHVNSILDSMSDAVIVVRPPAADADWREAVIVTVNPAACAMLARAREEILGQPVGALIPDIAATPGAAAADHGVWLEEVLRHGKAGSREVVYKVRDGREVPVLFSSAVMRQSTGGVQGIVYAAHDLTEIKSAEARNQFIKDTFGRYVSDDVVASLLSSPEALALGGELRKVTVMMSDLRGFTALAERLSPEDAVRFLNGYLQSMVDLILHYRGTINEIMGDGILVIFGAPTAASDDAERAVACAVAMQQAMAGVNARSRERGLPAIEMGIGVHTGEVIVGNIGSDRRMKYAAVGSNVNLTGRIESYTTGGQILISESTRAEVEPIVKLGPVFRIEPKGARRPMTVWQVNGIGGVHDLSLDAPEPAMIALAEAIPIRFAVLQDKHVGQRVLAAGLTRMSATGAEIRTETAVPPLSNVKIWVPDIDAGGEPAEIYAKVVRGEPADGPGFVVRFTAVTFQVVEELQRRAVRS